MTEVNGSAQGGFAAIAVVARCAQALEKARSRPGHLPGMVGLYGPAGLGKTWSAAHQAARFRAVHLECRSIWTRKDVGRKLARDLSLDDKGTLVELIERSAEELMKSNRAVILDDFDNLVSRDGLAELVRDLYELSGAPILLIGEERLPSKVERIERLHSRVLEWVPAPFCDLKDARALASCFAPGVAIADDLLEHVVRLTGGSIRRVAVNIEAIRTTAESLGAEEIDRRGWGDRPLSTGRCPEVRR